MRRLTRDELAIAHAPLLPQRRTLLLLNKAVEFTLDPLEPFPRALWELPVKGLADFLPLLAEVNALVPNEVHFFFFILGARLAAAFAASSAA